MAIFSFPGPLCGAWHHAPPRLVNHHPRHSAWQRMVSLLWSTLIFLSLLWISRWNLVPLLFWGRYATILSDTCIPEYIILRSIYYILLPPHRFLNCVTYCSQDFRSQLATGTPMFLLRINIHLSNGSVMVLTSNNLTWRVGPSPVNISHILRLLWCTSLMLVYL